MIDPNDFDLQIKIDNNLDTIYCPIRKKWLVLTPEEFVRQSVIQFLNIEKKVPLGLIAVEKVVKLGNQSRRFDLVAYSTNNICFLLCEFKAPNIQINENTSQQIAHYNQFYNANFLFLSNLNQNFVFQKQDLGYKQIENIPSFDEILKFNL